MNNNINLLNEVLQQEMDLQALYNKNMMEITSPEIRQLFTQLRDEKMGNISQLQKEIENLNKNLNK
ncbi:spore coat protein [Clostridium swellfunianum]|uniref:DUF2383 domain-containing protein n=1 Tax=Clostridium swellfunianum TaxID=1367462 RepID=UPI0020304FC1|nr:DUF2383 domain-containing protein [Clostridium swellfunianum]MCM0647276.1 spore coat protein [Clostridium swellfunianum]